MSHEAICRNCCWWLPNRKDFAECLDGREFRLCLHSAIARETDDEYSCEHFTAPSATEINVPQHTNRPNMSHTELRNAKPVDGPVEILIVTHAKDFGWLVYALRCARKYLSGFQGITIAVPGLQADLFCPLVEAFDVRLYTYHEHEGKGMLQHMVKMAEADRFLPDSTKYVMHLDADCMFHTPTTPEDYFYNDKPIYLIRTWDSLSTEDPKNPGSKVISDCAQWRLPTEKQLGMTTNWYTMCRHPSVFPVAFYAPYRQRIEKVHKMPFDQYMLSGRNEFPQSVMDFTAMGAFAHQFMYNSFHWIDCGSGPFPADRQKTFHSHSGITAQVQNEIESYLR